MNVFFIFFSVKKYDFMHFEMLFPFQNAQYSNFSRKPGKILGFTSNLVTLYTSIIFIWPNKQIKWA